MRPTTPTNRPDARPSPASRRRNRRRPILERCEGRTLLTTFTVNALTDSGAGRGNAGDLRYVLRRANADGGRDTIKFAVTGTIQLGSALPSIVDPRGIVIAGPGADALTIRGSGPAAAFTMLRVKQGAAADISGVTFADGNALQSGGAIFNGGQLTVTNAAFSNNYAPRNGGAINNVGDLTVTDSTFVGNSTGGNGGAVNSYQPFVVSGSTFSGNNAANSGGALEATQTDLIVSASTLVGNVAGFFGGGISINGRRDLASRGGTLKISDSTVANNAAGRSPGGGFGGGISANDGDLTITRTAVTGNLSNRAAGGLGINGGTVIVTGSTLNNNAASVSGGGLAINGGISVSGQNRTEGASLAFNDSTINNNVAGVNGGAIVATLAAVKLDGATLQGNSAGDLGGGISLQGDRSYTQTRGTLTVADTSISGNAAGRLGGGIANFDYVILTSSATITGNLAGQSGGGIYNARDLKVDQATIAGNRPDDVFRAT